MARYHTVIWDWNGTLADDADASLLAVNDMLSRRDMPPITMAQYYEYIDTPISRFYAHLFDLNEVPMSVISVEFAEGYARHFQGLHPGARELLQKLKDAGMDQIILSSNHLESTEAQLRRFDIRDYFSQVLGAAVLIGDTLHDYDTAKAMGVPCILCAIGHQSKEDLLTAGVPVVEQFTQLESLLLPQNTAKN